VVEYTRGVGIGDEKKTKHQFSAMNKMW